MTVACGSAPLDRADVQAAKACQAFYLYVSGSATGPDTLNAITPLLANGSQRTSSSATAATTQPAAKWASLGNDLLKATGAAFTHDGAKLKLFGDKASSECASIPARAKKAGNFTH
ncbi:MAG TPA: hypothetical protein VKV69_09350 [Actinomycetota bacterium]|nr:hypothetical protein [Actinomycetota bacterium]